MSRPLRTATVYHYQALHLSLIPFIDRIPKPPTCPPGLKSSNDKPSSSDTMGQNLKPGQNPKPKYVMIRFSRMVKKRRPVSRRADPDALLMRMMMGLVEGSDYEESDDDDGHHDLLAREAPGRAPAEMETYWDFEVMSLLVARFS